jgi:hypothetical protein
VADVPVTEAQATLLDGVGGVVLTGLIIGLGSGPTHEVIRLVQESKKNRKEPIPVAPTTDSANGRIATNGTADTAALPAFTGGEKERGGDQMAGDPVFEPDASTRRMLRPTRLISTD